MFSLFFFFEWVLQKISFKEKNAEKILLGKNFRITNFMIKTKKFTLSNCHYPLVRSAESFRVVIRIFGLVGDTPHIVYEVLRKVDCPALNVRARCATTSSSLHVCNTSREGAYSHTRTLSLSLSHLSGLCQISVVPYTFNAVSFTLQKSGKKGKRVRMPGCRVAVHPAPVFAYERERGH